MAKLFLILVVLVGCQPILDTTNGAVDELSEHLCGWDRTNDFTADPTSDRCVRYTPRGTAIAVPAGTDPCDAGKYQGVQIYPAAMNVDFFSPNNDHTMPVIDWVLVDCP